MNSVIMKEKLMWICLQSQSVSETVEYHLHILKATTVVNYVLTLLNNREEDLQYNTA